MRSEILDKAILLKDKNRYVLAGSHKIQRCGIKLNLTSYNFLGSLLRLDDAAEPAGEGQGPDWSSPLNEEVLSNGTGKSNHCYEEYNLRKNTNQDEFYKIKLSKKNADTYLRPEYN
jgi:hypothetical protein